ncbi:MAG TPA: DMT family transporter [Bryobacteraceae bacterium]|nr:DMT family transporter [Bryobacteraceae bacterium]
MEHRRFRYRLYLLAALLFSTGGAAIKSARLSGWQVASFRSGVAAVVLLLAMPAARRGWERRAVPVAAAYAATLVLYVLANRLTTAANAIFLQSTAPLYVLLLAPLLLQERVRARDLLYAAAVAGGLALFFVSSEQAVATAPDPRRGNLVGLAAGLSWALTLTGLRWLERNGADGSGMVPVVLGNALACLAALPMAVPVTGAGVTDVAVIFYLGVVQVGLAYVLLTWGLRHVPAFEASAVLLLEPVMNPVWAWLVHKERPGGWPLAGGAVIIVATLVNTWAGAQRVGSPAPGSC